MTVTASAPETAEVVAASRGRVGWRRVVRGRESDAAWERPALLALLGATALLYLWNLSASGWANAFYSAAVEAGAHSWSAFFFGSFDSSNFITVDKSPAALWVMDLSARLFGVNAWSILAPQALEGVAAVGLLYATMRRWFSPAAALLAGAVMALTPVAALMFRFNNPDALLVLLLVGSAYALTRALEHGSTRWLLLVGSLIGVAFLAKMLQAFLVVPPFVLVYLIAAPGSLWRRLGQLIAAGAAMLLSGGWWVAAMVLIPAGSRPYIGGSQNNNILNLIFGYNGFGRLTGNEAGSVGGAPRPGGGRWGPTGLLRLFQPDMGGQVSWLLPAALLALGALLWLTWRAPRTDRLRAATLLWGGWLLVTGVVFSYAEGIIHPYYTVALAPAIGALVGIGAVSLWQRRADWVARGLLAVAVAGTAYWAARLLGRSPIWHPELRTIVLVAGLGSAVWLLLERWLPRQTAVALVVVALVASLAAPAAYAAQTAATPHSGAIPSAGPAATGGGRGAPGGFARVGPGAFVPGSRGGANGNTFPNPPANATGGTSRNPTTPGSFFRRPSGGNSQGTSGSSNAFGNGAGNRTGNGNGNGAGFAGPGGLGGLLNASRPDAALVSLLQQDAHNYTWVSAIVGAENAAGIQLAANEPVMAIGGFNGTDPAPSLAEFQQDVSQGKIHYFIAGGGFGGFGGPGGQSGGNVSGQITSWVEQHFIARAVGTLTVYDLTQPVT